MKWTLFSPNVGPYKCQMNLLINECPFLFSHESMVCLSGTRVESRIVSPGHSKGNKVMKQSPVATLTQRRATPFDVSPALFWD